MEIKIYKKDFWLAILAGEIVAWLSLPTLKNIKIIDILYSFGINFNLFLSIWVIFVPLGAIGGLGAFYLIARIKQRIGFFQLGKYGVIGVLNTFLNAGVFNLLIFLTDVSTGLIVDSFFVVAFMVTLMNSFLWNKFWAFEERKIENIKKEMLQFSGISAGVALINIAILHTVVNIIGAPIGIDSKIWANVGLVFTIIVAFSGNFFSYKYIVFKK